MRRIRRLAKRFAHLQPVVENIGWLGMDRVVRLLSGFLVTVFLVRHLGPAGYGTLAYAMAVAGIFVPLASVGMDSIAVRELVRNPGDDLRTLGSAFVLKAIGGVVATAAAVAMVVLARPGAELVIAMVAIVALPNVLRAAEVVEYWFNSRVEARFAVLAKGVVLAGAVAARLGLIGLDAPAEAFAWVLCIEIALNSLALIVVYRYRGASALAWRFEYARARELLSESWPLMLSGFAILVYMKIDQAMLGSMTDDGVVGVYSVSVSISEACYFIPVIVGASVLPALVRLHSRDTQRYEERFSVLCRLFVIFSVAVVVPVVVLSKPLVAFLFGAAYSQAATILSVHILAAPFVFLGVLGGKWSEIEGLTRFVLYRTVGGAVLNILLNAFLIPPYGGMGAAVATVLSYACSGILLNVLHPRARPIFRMQLAALCTLGLAGWRKRGPSVASANGG